MTERPLGVGDYCAFIFAQGPQRPLLVVDVMGEMVEVAFTGTAPTTNQRLVREVWIRRDRLCRVPCPCGHPAVSSRTLLPPVKWRQPPK